MMQLFQGRTKRNLSIMLSNFVLCLKRFENKMMRTYLLIKEYHFEIVCATELLAKDVKKLINSFGGITAKTGNDPATVAGSGGKSKSKNRNKQMRQID